MPTPSADRAGRAAPGTAASYNSKQQPTRDCRYSRIQQLKRKPPYSKYPPAYTLSAERSGAAAPDTAPMYNSKHEQEAERAVTAVCSNSNTHRCMHAISRELAQPCQTRNIVQLKQELERTDTAVSNNLNTPAVSSMKWLIVNFASCVIRTAANERGQRRQLESAIDRSSWQHSEYARRVYARDMATSYTHASRFSGLEAGC